jgi:rod shape-determining protein MreD
MSEPTRKIVYWVIVFGLFVLQSTLFYWIVPGAWSERIAPNAVLIAVVISSLFVGRHYALGLGVAFGFLHDLLFYGHMLGLYTFVMGLTGYLTGLAFPRKHMPMLYVLLVVAVGELFFDSVVYLLYRLFQITTSAYDTVFMKTILPSLLFNLFLAAALYVPLRHYVARMVPKPESEES